MRCSQIRKAMDDGWMDGSMHGVSMAHGGPLDLARSLCQDAGQYISASIRIYLCIPCGWTVDSHPNRHQYSIPCCLLLYGACRWPRVYITLTLSNTCRWTRGLRWPSTLRAGSTPWRWASPRCPQQTCALPTRWVLQGLRYMLT